MRTDKFKPKESKVSIQVQIKEVYGRQLAYPMCHLSELMAKLAGKKSFTHDMLQAVAASGVEIVYVPSFFQKEDL